VLTGGAFEVRTLRLISATCEYPATKTIGLWKRPVCGRSKRYEHPRDGRLAGVGAGSFLPRAARSRGFVGAEIVLESRQDATLLLRRRNRSTWTSPGLDSGPPSSLLKASHSQ
jgi:hypothetical protein